MVVGCASVQQERAVEEQTYTLSFEGVECGRGEETCIVDFRVEGSKTRITMGIDRWELDAVARSLSPGVTDAGDLPGKAVTAPALEPNLAINLLAVREMHRAPGRTYRPPSSEELLDRLAHAFARMEKPDLRDVAEVDQLDAAGAWFPHAPFRRAPLIPETYDLLVRRVWECSNGAVVLERAYPGAFARISKCVCGVEHLTLRRGGETQFVAVTELLPIVWFDRTEGGGR